jgi:hypothetical protein
MNRKRNPELDSAYSAMGKYNEKRFKSVIEAEFGKCIQSGNEYEVIDFYGEDYILELKSRCCSSTDYIDTMFGYNKIVEANKKLANASPLRNDYKVYFAFAFTDGLFVWEYNSKTYEENGGDTQRRIGGTDSRDWEDYKEHYYVFVKNLRKISDKPVWIHPKVLENLNKKLEEKKQKSFKSKIPDEICFLKLMKTT